jgi:hypothetical protein
MEPLREGGGPVADPIWMEHEETGGRALLPDILAWRGKGWKPADGPPPEPDLLHDPAEPADVDPQVNPDSTPADDPQPAGEPVPQPTPLGEEPVPAPKTSKANPAATREEQ